MPLLLLLLLLFPLSASAEYLGELSVNSYATDAPRPYDQQGHYRGKLSVNPYDPDSVSNPYGRYGRPYSSESLNNLYCLECQHARQS